MRSDSFRGMAFLLGLFVLGLLAWFVISISDRGQPFAPREPAPPVEQASNTQPG